MRYYMLLSQGCCVMWIPNVPNLSVSSHQLSSLGREILPHQPIYLYQLHLLSLLCNLPHANSSCLISLVNKRPLRRCSFQEGGQKHSVPNVHFIPLGGGALAQVLFGLSRNLSPNCSRQTPPWLSNQAQLRRGRGDGIWDGVGGDFHLMRVFDPSVREIDDGG